MHLDGKIAVVTGGASGIGEAICVRFREEGAKLAVLDLNVEAGKLTADIAGGGLALGTDVSDSAAVDAALAEVEDTLGPVDVWVNNAGIAGRAHAQRVQPRAEQQMSEMATGTVTTALNALIEITDEEFQQMVAVHSAARSTAHGRPPARWRPAAPARSSTSRPSAASKGVRATLTTPRRRPGSWDSRARRRRS